MATPKDVATWMLQKIKDQKIIYQEVVVYEIAKYFGKEFTYINLNGNLAIDSQVLKEFRKLTEDFVVWSRGERCWRFRENYDNSTKRQAL